MTALDPTRLTQHSKLFALLDEAGQKRLFAVAEEERVPTGTSILREGETGDAFYLLIEGEVSVRIGGIEQKCEVARLAPGAFFGEIAALLGEARSASIFALTPCLVLRFDRKHVQDLLKAYPRVREVLVKLGLSRSEENLQHQLEGDFQASASVMTTAEGEAIVSQVRSQQDED